jgi:hypothetical protein
VKPTGRLIRKMVDLSIGHLKDVNLYLTPRGTNQRASRPTRCSTSGQEKLELRSLT